MINALPLLPSKTISPELLSITSPPTSRRKLNNGLSEDKKIKTSIIPANSKTDHYRNESFESASIMNTNSDFVNRKTNHFLNALVDTYVVKLINSTNTSIEK